MCEDLLGKDPSCQYSVLYCGRGVFFLECEVECEESSKSLRIL